MLFKLSHSDLDRPGQEFILNTLHIVSVMAGVDAGIDSGGCYYLSIAMMDKQVFHLRFNTLEQQQAALDDIISISQQGAKDE